MDSTHEPSARKPPTEARDHAVVLVACTGFDPTRLTDALAAEAGAIEVRQWPDMGDPAAIDYALVWQPPPGLLRALPDLKAVFALSAGVETLLEPGLLPDHVPLVRMIDPGVTAAMAEFVLMRVLHHHRRMHEYAAAQARREWTPLLCKPAAERAVGIMGLGELGAACATVLTAHGFAVRGWSRSAKDIADVRSYHGPDALNEFLRATEILVCLLPLTRETEGMIDARLLATLPAGACLINVGRGGHVVDRDLLASLDRGHLGAATLDVFTDEPLPRDHPYWRHPSVTVVPHSAALVQASGAARLLFGNIARHRAGLPLEHVVDRRRGY